MNLTEITDQQIWDEFVSRSPHGHPLQLWAWGEVKRTNGWEPLRLGVQVGDQLSVAAQVLLWSVPKTKHKLAYVPRGPVIDPLSPELPGLLVGVAEAAKSHGAIQMKIEPAWQSVRLPDGWREAKDHVLMKQTYTIDLNQELETITGAFATKARQYVRKAEREGVTVRRVMEAGEIGKVMAVYQETAARAKFGLHHADYYTKLLTAGGPANYLLVAEKDDQAVAFVWLLAAGGTAFELYGGMTAEGARLHANYALKDHAISQMKAEGFAVYDFNGRLNEGVSHFKAQWGAAETDWLGSWNLPLKQPHYAIWRAAWPIGKRLAKVGK